MPPPQTPRIALFTRYPRAGEAKTRLIPAIGPEDAARVHRVLVERTIATIRASGLPFAVWYTGAPREAFAQWLGEDVDLVEQGNGDLGARLARVPAPAILLGADIPALGARHLEQAAGALRRNDSVVGPARDGGYYLLGYSEECPALFTDMAWGTDKVFEATLRRLAAAGRTFALLETLDDCDRPADLAHWPDLLAQ